MPADPVALDDYRKEIGRKAEQLSTEAAERISVGGGGSGPRDPGMERRVATLETDVREIKSSLKALEHASVRIEATVVTKTDLAVVTDALSALSERMRAADERAGRIEKSLDGALAAAIGRSIGWWQFPVILGSSAAVLMAAAVALNWLLLHGYFPRSP